LFLTAIVANLFICDSFVIAAETAVAGPGAVTVALDF
jgi:hypothetical protein